jgi:hypothetical protein
VLKKLPDVMVVMLTLDSQKINISFCVLVSSIVIEIKVLLIDEILDNFVRPSV